MPPDMNSENLPENLPGNLLENWPNSTSGMNPGVGSSPATAKVDAETSAQSKARPPAVYKMRCPSCQKLYSVQSQVILAASLPLQFQCQSCQTRFETPVLEARNLYNETLTTYEITPVVPAASQPAASGEAPCPKCRGLNAANAVECKHCGIVFEKFAKAARGEKAEDFGVRRELAEMWAAILEDYSRQEFHDRFVEECYKSNALAFAAQKYSRILGAAPNEDIAKSMRRRIIALSSFKTETASASTVRKEAAEVEGAGGFFRYIKVSHFVFLVGGALITSGMLLPASRDLVGLGVALITLAIGVMYFRPKV